MKKVTEDRDCTLKLKKALLKLQDLGVDGIVIMPGDIGHMRRYEIVKTIDPLIGHIKIQIREISLPPLPLPEKGTGG